MPYNISIKFHPISSTLNFSRLLWQRAILKFLSLNIMCTHVRQNFWKVSSNFEHHSKPTMNINSQHHNLLGNQISPKSEDFRILVAILDSKWPPQQANDGYQFPTSKSTRKPNFAQIGGFLYLVAILYLGYHGNAAILIFFNPPKAATHYGGYSYKVS